MRQERGAWAHDQKSRQRLTNFLARICASPAWEEQTYASDRMLMGALWRVQIVFIALASIKRMATPNKERRQRALMELRDLKWLIEDEKRMSMPFQLARTVLYARVAAMATRGWMLGEIEAAEAAGLGSASLRCGLACFERNMRVEVYLAPSRTLAHWMDDRMEECEALRAQLAMSLDERPDDAKTNDGPLPTYAELMAECAAWATPGKWPDFVETAPNVDSELRAGMAPG